MLSTRARGILLISTVWAVAWYVIGVGLAVRLALEPAVGLSRLAVLASILGSGCARIGFACGAAFSLALMVLGPRGVRHAGVRLAGPSAAALVGALSSGSLLLEPAAVSAAVCAGFAAACGVASLAIANHGRSSAEPSYDRTSHLHSGT